MNRTPINRRTVRNEKAKRGIAQKSKPHGLAWGSDKQKITLQRPERWQRIRA